MRVYTHSGTRKHFQGEYFITQVSHLSLVQLTLRASYRSRESRMNNRMYTEATFANQLRIAKWKSLF